MEGINITDDSAGGAPPVGVVTKGPKVSERSTGAPLLTDLLASVGRQSELGAQANQFIETLTDQLKKELGPDVEVERIQDKMLDVYYALYADQAVLLVFSETYSVPSDSHIPPTNAIEPAATALKAHRKCRILTTDVITPRDYVNVNKFSANLSNLLKVNSGNFPNVTIDSLRSGKYTVSTNIADVRAAIERFNPKTTAPRTDIGLVLYNCEDEVIAGSRTGQQKTTPVLVIGAYTKFISTAGTQASYSLGSTAPSFVAVTCITSVLGPIMVPSMLSLAIPLAVEQFIRRNGWLQPYTVFKKDASNLGSLILNEKNKPHFIENMQELGKFVNQYIARPYLAIDVTEGYIRIPGIQSFVWNENDIRQGIANFLGCDAASIQNKIVYERMHEYIGELVDDGKDTRNIDYLTLVAAGCHDLNVLMRYLYQPPEPHLRASLISSQYEIRTLYSNTTAVLDSNFVDMLARAVSSVFRPIWENANLPENQLGDLNGVSGNQFGIGPMFQSGMNYSWSGVNHNPYA